MSLSMQLRRSPQLASFTLKTLSAAVIATTLMAPALGAGLGKLTVLSALGQPLNAEIELTSVGRDEAGNLVAKLASADAFRQANIELNPALYSIRFTVEQRGTRPVIRVTSAQPMNEPFVDMLLELGGTNGRLVREYTFLLDPADLRSAQVTAPVAAVVPAPVRAPRGQGESPPLVEPKVIVERAEPVPERKPIRSRASEDASSANGAAKSYKVKRGDSLARIANQVRSNGVSLDQMLVAIYRANPAAFVGENMNRMRTGQILSIPSAESASGIANTEAHGVVVAQAQDFSTYRNKLAGQVSTSAPQKASASTQTAGGSIVAKVEEQKNSASDSKDKLKLSKSGVVAPSGVGTSAPAKAATGPTAEEQIAKDKAITEANTRVRELEKNVAELQKILELKNKNLAEQQRKAEVGVKPTATNDGAQPADKTVVPTEVKNTVAIAPAASSPPTTQTTATTTATTTALNPAQTVPVKPDVTAVPSLVNSSPANPTPAIPASASTVSTATNIVNGPGAVPPPDIQTPKQAVVIVKQKKPAAASPSSIESSFMDDLLGNAFVLPALGLVLIALGALGIVGSRRKKKNQQFEDSILTDSNLKANSLFGSTGGQSVDTNNSVFNSNFAPTASQLDANEVDPVAEADVYIAYGRDAQAEEILKEALRTQPERHAVRTKLLEIYATRKDVRSFDTMASELYGMTKGEGEDWAHVASMGAALDPNNPLYAGAKLPASPVSTAAIAGSTVAAENLDLESLLATTHHPDLPVNELTDSPPFDHIDHIDHIDHMPVNAEITPLPGSIESHDLVHPHAMLENTRAIDTSKVESKQVVASTINNGLDFDLAGLTLPDAPASAAIHPTHHDTNHDLNHDLNSLNFDMPATIAAPAIGSNPQQTPTTIETEGHAAPAILTGAAVTAATVAGLDTLHHQHVDHSLEQPLESPPAALLIPKTVEPVVVKPDPLEFDLSGISLDLNPSDVVTAPHTSAVVSSNPAHVEHEASDTLVLEDESISNAPEMATKLDLAMAYEEIGDKEGARELLDEVIKGGSADQIMKAKQMLSKLG